MTPNLVWKTCHMFSHAWAPLQSWTLNSRCPTKPIPDDYFSGLLTHMCCPEFLNSKSGNTYWLVLQSTQSIGINFWTQEELIFLWTILNSSSTIRLRPLGLLLLPGSHLPISFVVFLYFFSLQVCNLKFFLGNYVVIHSLYMFPPIYFILR